jgi:SAM-dependent methyltransferase
MNPTSSSATPPDPGTYVGSELELFAHAVNWKTYFARQLSPFIDGAVLEVGAGLGGTTATLWKPGLSRWVCLEPDVELCRQIEARKEEGQLDGQVEVVAGCLTDLPAEQRFDTILYIDVLEHIEDDVGEMKQARARLKPGGRVVILVPAHQWLFSALDAAIGHFRRYSRPTLRRVMPPDLELERLRYLDSVGVLASSANRFMMRQSMPTPAQLGFWDKALVPASRLLDPLLCFAVGKSLVGVWHART